eukprot:4846294-Prymnesium_polylepis.1
MCSLRQYSPSATRAHDRTSPVRTTADVKFRGELSTHLRPSGLLPPATNHNPDARRHSRLLGSPTIQFAWATIACRRFGAPAGPK